MLYGLDGVEPRLEGEGIFVAPDASVIGNCLLHDGSSIWFNCVLRGDNDPIVIGAMSNIQDGTVCHTDLGAPLRVGAGVTVGHKVMLHGCSIADNSLIGMGSVILNHAKIGENVIVGANALITEGKTIPDGVLVMGSPAKVIRPIKEEERRLIALSRDIYAANAKRFLGGLTALS